MCHLAQRPPGTSPRTGLFSPPPSMPVHLRAPSPLRAPRRHLQRADSRLMEPSTVTSSADHPPSWAHHCGESFPSLPPQSSHILLRLAIAANPAHLVAGLSGVERRRRRPVATPCASPISLRGWQPSPGWADQKRPKCTVDLHNFQLN
jgi:hypothetical protein